MNNKISYLSIALLVISLVVMIPTNSFAQSLGIDTEKYHDVSTPDRSGNIGGLADTIFVMVQQVGAGISAIYIVVLGIRYILSASEDRADIKKRAIPYLIGIALFFGVTFFVNALRNISSLLPTAV